MIKNPVQLYDLMNLAQLNLMNPSPNPFSRTKINKEKETNPLFVFVQLNFWFTLKVVSGLDTPIQFATLKFQFTLHLPQTCSEMVLPIGRDTNVTMFPPARTFRSKQLLEGCQCYYGVPRRLHWVTTYYGGHACFSTNFQCTFFWEIIYITILHRHSTMWYGPTTETCMSCLRFEPNGPSYNELRAGNAEQMESTFHPTSPRRKDQLSLQSWLEKRKKLDMFWIVTLGWLPLLLPTTYIIPPYNSAVIYTKSHLSFGINLLKNYRFYSLILFSFANIWSIIFT